MLTSSVEVLSVSMNSAMICQHQSRIDMPESGVCKGDQAVQDQVASACMGHMAYAAPVAMCCIAAWVQTHECKLIIHKFEHLGYAEHLCTR